MKLDPLPPTKDEYWEHSVTEIQEVREAKECDHFFMHRSGREIECRKCFIGYELYLGWEVKGGKLYTPDGLVV